MATRNSLDGNVVASGSRIVAVDTTTDVTFGDVRPKGLYVVGAGNVLITNENGDGTFTTVTVAVPANFVLPVGPYKIESTADGTTATGIFAIY